MTLAIAHKTPKRRGADRHRCDPRGAPAVLAGGCRRRVRRALQALSHHQDHRRPFWRRVRQGAVPQARHQLRDREAAQVRPLPRPVAAAEQRPHHAAEARPPRLADRRSRAPRVARRQGLDRPRPARPRRLGECRCRRRRCDPAAVLRSVHGLRLRGRAVRRRRRVGSWSALGRKRRPRRTKRAAVRNMAGPFHFRGTAILGES